MKRVLLPMGLTLVGLVAVTVWAGAPEAEKAEGGKHACCMSKPADCKKACSEAEMAACKADDKKACSEAEMAACKAGDKKTCSEAEMADCKAKQGCKHEGKEAATIDAAALKALLDAKAPVTLLDARSGKYDDGSRIADATSLAPNASDAQIASALPVKDAPIVAYCVNTHCPASHKLAERLESLGYQNVKIMPEGIEGWKEAGNEVHPAGSTPGSM